MRVIFNSEWFAEPLEVIFEDVRRFNVAGWQSMYTDEIFECSLAIRDDLDRNVGEKVILWTDGGHPCEQREDELLNEPICTYVMDDMFGLVEMNYGIYAVSLNPLSDEEISSGKVDIATALAMRSLCLEACEAGKIIAINDAFYVAISFCK